MTDGPSILSRPGHTRKWHSKVHPYVGTTLGLVVNYCRQQANNVLVLVSHNSSLRVFLFSLCCLFPPDILLLG